jgi:diaminohydroxyphosphoribosylaminopyrimidine deaminase/5-amino-6-(5-phosphoribosylamino)uracil reductase
LDAQIATVVIALIDPTSRGVGGAALLRHAGINVELGLLADEARLVIGPWLATLETQRPFTTWAYTLPADGVSSGYHSAIVNELRHQFDVVLDLTGTPQEGVTGAHGADVLTFPDLRPPYKPQQTLDALHAGGVRSLLVLGAPAMVEPFLSTQAIDRIEIQSTLTTSNSPSPTSWATLPPGYRWTSFARTQFGVRASAIRVTS